MPVCCHALPHDDNELASETVSNPHLNALFYELLGSWGLFKTTEHQPRQKL